MVEQNGMHEQEKYKAETDFCELRTKPMKLFPLFAVFMLSILILIGVTYVSQLTVVGKNSIPPIPPPDSASLVMDIPVQTPRVVPPVDVLKASVSSSEDIATGRSLFKANCSSCHGENGQGDGPSSATLNPKPRNLASEKNWTNGSKISSMYKTLEIGILSNGMPAFNYLTPQDRFALIHFIRTLYPNHPVDSTDELKKLDTMYALSKGMTVSGQIPLRKAKEIILKEQALTAQEIADDIKATEFSVEQGANLLREYANDQQRVFASCVNMKQQLPDFNNFIEVVAVNPVQFGFKPAVTKLSTLEWNALYTYLRDRVH